MGTKSSKSKTDDSKCSKYCTLVYGPELPEDFIMSGSSHIRNVLIGVEYRNCCRTLDGFFLLFAIWMGQIQSKLIYIFVTYELASW